MWRKRPSVDKSAPRRPPTDPDMTVDKFLAANALTDAQRRDLARVEQGGEAWLAVKGRFMSGTGVGPATGESDYDGPDDFIRKRLWPEMDPPSPAMLLGQRDEKFCAISLEAGLLRALADPAAADRIPIPPTPHECAVERTPAPMRELGFSTAPCDLLFDSAGFLVPAVGPADRDLTPAASYPDVNWIGVSPDAIITYRGNMVLGEFKRPMDGRFYSQKKHRRTGIPKAYVAQIQSTMNIMNIEWCFFAVMSEKQGIEMRLFKRDREYWKRVGAAARTFYFERLVPAIVAKARGMLRLGEIEPDFGVGRSISPTIELRLAREADEDAVMAVPPDGFSPSLRVVRVCASIDRI